MLRRPTILIGLFLLLLRPAMAGEHPLVLDQFSYPTLTEGLWWHGEWERKLNNGKLELFAKAASTNTSGKRAELRMAPGTAVTALEGKIAIVESNHDARNSL